MSHVDWDFLADRVLFVFVRTNLISIFAINHIKRFSSDWTEKLYHDDQGPWRTPNLWREQLTIQFIFQNGSNRYIDYVAVPAAPVAFLIFHRLCRIMRSCLPQLTGLVWECLGLLYIYSFSLASLERLSSYFSFVESNWKVFSFSLCGMFISF